MLQSVQKVPAGWRRDLYTGGGRVRALDLRQEAAGRSGRRRCRAGAECVATKSQATGKGAGVTQIRPSCARARSAVQRSISSVDAGSTSAAGGAPAETAP